MHPSMKHGFLVAQTVKNVPLRQETQVLPWRRKWQPTPVFLPGKFHGCGNLIGHSPWGCKELDATEKLSLSETESQTQRTDRWLPRGRGRRDRWSGRLGLEETSFNTQDG